VATATSNRGMLYRQVGKVELAISDFTNAIRIAPEAADAYRERGETLAALGKREAAIDDLRKAVRLDGDDEETRREPSELNHPNKD
jgi:tetratricopeptide (TPR) repeat protein